MWPKTAEAMAFCKVLFNRGQKHDGPNQRVIESMLMDRPLISDRDARDGMKQLFEEGEHYLAYSSEAELANNLEWCLREPSLAGSMARRAYELAKEKHQVKHRIEQILEICNVK
jgi:spore maturation protein CgeB